MKTRIGYVSDPMFFQRGMTHHIVYDPSTQGVEKVIGFCVEPPADVLRQLYPKHLIAGYRDLPFAPEERGIVIAEANGTVLPGTDITGKLEDLDLGRYRISQTNPPHTQRTKRAMLAMMREAHYLHLRGEDEMPETWLEFAVACLESDPEEIHRILMKVVA
jgi:hypothetical protein